MRTVNEDDQGRTRAVYRSLGKDDFLHAEAYDLVASKALEYRDIWTGLMEPRYVTLEDLVPEFEPSRLGELDEDPPYRPGPPDPSDLDLYDEW